MPTGTRAPGLLLAGFLSAAAAAPLVADDLNVTELYLPPPPPDRCGPCAGPADWTKCEFWGDPHYTKSFFQEKFNYQGMGVHHVASACDESIVVQDFHCPWQGKAKAAVAVGIAVKIHGKVVYMSDKTITIDGRPATRSTPRGLHVEGDLGKFPGIKLTTKDTCLGINVLRKSKSSFRSPTFYYDVKMGVSKQLAEKEGICGTKSASARRYIPNRSPEMLFTRGQIKEMCSACNLEEGAEGTPLNCLPKELEKEEELESWKCKKLVSVRRGGRANRRFWQRYCRKITKATKMLAMKYNSGGRLVTDLFRPLGRATYCQMLLSHRRHRWSRDGLTWRTPEYAPTDEALYGGCKRGWPQRTVRGDVRERLGSWGPEAGYSFDLYYCEGGPAGAAPAEGQTPEKACQEASPPIPMHKARRMCDPVRKKSTFVFDSCMIDYCSSDGDEEAVIDAMEEVFTDPWKRGPRRGITVSAASGRPYQVVHSWAVGDLAFTDRDYKFLDLGGYTAAQGWVLIRVPNDDKDTPADKVQFELRVSVDCDVVLAYYGRSPQQHSERRPWMRADGWTNFDELTLPRWNVRREPFTEACKKFFRAGLIKIKGNNGAGYGNPVVFVRPRHGRVQSLIDRFGQQGAGQVDAPGAAAWSPSTWTAAGTMAVACVGLAAAAALVLAAPWVALRRRWGSFRPLALAEQVEEGLEEESKALMPLE